MSGDNPNGLHPDVASAEPVAGESPTPAARVAYGRLAGLADAAIAIAQAPTIDDALHTLTERARLLIGAHQAVTSLTSGRDLAQSISAVSLSEKYARFRGFAMTPTGEGIYALVCESNRSMRLTQAELEAHPRYHRGDLAADHPPLRGWLAAPLVAREGQNLGLIQLSDKYEGEFDAQDEAILVQLAQLGAALIENMRLIEQMHEARAEAESANRAKSDFLATMSHEIRTPINAVMGYTELLEIGVSGPLNETQREHLSRIRASSIHLLRLVEEVLDFAKIEAGQLTVHVDDHRIATATDLALALVRPQAQARSITIEEHCTVSEIQYRGDADRVRQILLNLLSNAVKFTPPGGNIVLDCDDVAAPPRGTRLPPGNWVYITVADSGVGVSPDMLHRIFEPFERGEQGHTRQYGGSGLGLAISRRLAQVMGGEITVSSRPGVGSTFTLWLPSARAPLHESTPHSTTATITSDPPTVDSLAFKSAGSTLLGNVLALQQEFVRRLRAEPQFVPFHRLPDAVLADHSATIVSDVGCCLAALHDADGAASPLLADAARIQRLVSERHGEQRARLGMTEVGLRREYALLRELMRDVLEREAAGRLDAYALAAVVDVVNSMVEQAEYTSLLAARRAQIR